MENLIKHINSLPIPEKHKRVCIEVIKLPIPNKIKKIIIKHIDDIKLEQLIEIIDKYKNNIQALQSKNNMARKEVEIAIEYYNKSKIERKNNTDADNLLLDESIWN